MKTTMFSAQSKLVVDVNGAYLKKNFKFFNDKINLT